MQGSNFCQEDRRLVAEGAGHTDIKIRAASGADSGEYQCRARSASGADSAPPVRLTVLEATTITGHRRYFLFYLIAKNVTLVIKIKEFVF